MKLNSANQFNPGDVIFFEGEQSNCLFLVLKGKIEISNRGFRAVLGPGMLMGVNSITGDVCPYSCKAVDAVTVYVYEAKTADAVERLFSSNKDYGGISLFTHARLLPELFRQLNRLTEMTASMHKCLKTCYTEYLTALKRTGCKGILIPEISQLEEFSDEFEYDEELLDYYLEYSKIPYESVKGFFGASMKLTLKSISDMFILEGSLIDACAAAADYVMDTFILLIGSEESSLYKSLCGLGIEVKKTSKVTSDIDEIIEACLGTMMEVKPVITKTTGREWLIDEDSINAMRAAYLEGRDFRSVEEVEEQQAVDGNVAEYLEQIKGSYNQIVEFAQCSPEEAERFRGYLDEFAGLSEKQAVDDNMRKLRRNIADCFYSLYEQALVASIGKRRLPKAIEMFLEYGLVDEKLLKEEQLTQLLSIKREGVGAPCDVYSIRSWLLAVYRGDKEPSRNDMGQDYQETLRDLKKSGKINDDQMKQMLVSGDERLKFEINNVFARANRVVNGQLSVFVPILYSDMFIGDIVAAYNTADKINSIIRKLVELDFSVFHREVLFSDPAAGIDREYEMKQVYPDMVVFPTVGHNAIMWQEITGRKRDSAGRFFIPAFSYGSLRDMFIKCFGQFRWDLCKTIQGINWNNIQYHSLTAEYSDYIQFYRKNRDLSDDRKEKIKLQIQRGRNNLREIFTIDYEIWMKSEAAGAVKLNKIARELLATFCPFSASVRDQLVKQPLYDEAFARSQRERTKKVHDLELRYKALEKQCKNLPIELTETLRFYKEL